PSSCRNVAPPFDVLTFSPNRLAPELCRQRRAQDSTIPPDSPARAGRYSPQPSHSQDARRYRPSAIRPFHGRSTRRPLQFRFEWMAVVLCALVCHHPAPFRFRGHGASHAGPRAGFGPLAIVLHRHADRMLGEVNDSWRLAALAQAISGPLAEALALIPVRPADDAVVIARVWP